MSATCFDTCEGCESCEEGKYGIYDCEDDDENCEGECKVCMSANCYCDIECCSCCDGQCYDPQTQGCCDDLTVYDKSGSGLGSIDCSGVYRDEPGEDSLRDCVFFAFCVEVAFGKAATQRYETPKSGGENSQGSGLNLLVALRGHSGLVAKRKATEGFFSKPYVY